MPSRKKAKGKARKAEKSKQQQQQHIYGSSACSHGLRSNIVDHEMDLCLTLCKDLDDQFNEMMRDEVFKSDILFEIVMDLYEKYRESIFSVDSIKAVCRRVLHFGGTAAVLSEANTTDSSQNSVILSPQPYLFMLVHIEFMEHEQGAAFDRTKMIWKGHCILKHIMTCTREIVRFFHRNSLCDCLKQLYYDLKVTTERTTYCANCNEIKDLRGLQECSKCKKAYYCSKDCAVAHHKCHKIDCKLWRQYLEEGAEEEVSCLVRKLNLQK